jgi:hemoglobin
MKKDIKNIADVQWMVDRFYDKIKEDKLVGFIFTDVMKVNWQKHLPIMYGFWENALFYTGAYNGNAMKKHININKQVPLQKKYFARWLHLFNETVDEYFEGEKATLAKQRAFSIATIIQLKIPKTTVK